MSDGKKKAIGVVVSDDVRKIIEELAQRQSTENKRVYASDIAREAIQEYLNARGYNVKVDVDRGGYRERIDSEE